MSLEEQKEILIQKIQSEKDEHVLNTVYHILERDFEVAEAEKVYLTDEQRKGVEQGLADIEAGRVYSHEEVMKKINDFKRICSYWNNRNKSFVQQKTFESF